MERVEIRHAAVSDVGLKRSQNEDRFYADSGLGLFIVCDGMGGGNAGEVASTLAVEMIQKHVMTAAQDPALPLVGDYDETVLPQTNRLASAIRLANRTVHAESHEPRYAGMGTTVVAAWIAGQVVSLAHVGDSRLYLVRDNRIQLLTTDHSLIMEQVRQGLLTEEQAEHAPHRNVVTRALGIERAVDVELGEVPVVNGDILLLCSDGLTRGVNPRDIVRVIQREQDLHAAAERLIGMANLAGGEDNTTVVLVTVEEGERPSFWRRLRNHVLPEQR
ncbi:Stp1/IreP family PP2C-type Ser/Thr phosphatase [Candidatus Nitrospira bockiana]